MSAQVQTPDGSAWQAPTLASADRERIRWKGFREFCRLAWPHVEPARMVWNWHHDEVCKHLQALHWMRDPALSLVINIPPGETKSTLASILFPAWVWTVEPSYRMITAAYSPDMATGFARKSLTLIQSRWYRERWGDVLGRSSAEGHYWSRSGGERLATAPGGKGTGYHGHLILVDDPVKAQAAGSTSAKKIRSDLDRANSWWSGAMATRVADPARGLAKCVVMQRLHEVDLTGFVLAGASPYMHLRLPAKYEPADPCVTELGGDIRTSEGQLLNPRRRNERQLNALAVDLGGWQSANAQAQLQQRPNPPGGAIWIKDQIKTFDPALRPPTTSLLICSVDATFKGGSQNDRVAIEVWGWNGRDLLCYYSETEQRGFVSTLAAIRRVVGTVNERGLYQVSHLLIEDTANGPAIIETLQGNVPCEVVALGVKAGKEARAAAAASYAAQGRIYLDSTASWYERKLTNMVRFPYGAVRDDVDATSQAVIWMASQFEASASFGAAMQAWDYERADAVRRGPQATFNSLFVTRVV